ncbi:MAG TPA: FHA domain-containing protein, partial [Tepidisphaeraceae bacterium]|nr:FHA domain-containing protein [Tepidisphaeraceae bacterium]
MITLVVLQGPDKGRRFELPDVPLIVGRESRQLPLTDNTVSRRHCELKPNEKNEWVLRDLGSANGTYINGQRTDRQTVLRLGDQFRVGRTLLVFGSQPGVMKSVSGNVELMDQSHGMDSSIINTMPSSDDSLVLAVPDPMQAAMSNLKMLYRLSAALGSSFSLQQICEVVMDIVFAHVQADRGIILLAEPNGAVVPKVVRVREETVARPKGKSSSKNPPAAPTSITVTPDEPERIQVSRTIVNHVMNTGDGVLSSNAMADPRFKKGKSVHDMGIRSCLCVPIKVRKLDSKPGDRTAEEIIGVIYIES